MDFLSITRIIALVGFVISLIGLGVRLKSILDRPFKQDLSRQRGQVRRGVLYAFTLGMAPWEKESTRLHWLAYIRGILFHLGIFAALALFVSALIPTVRLDLLPVWLKWPLVALLGLGGVLGFAGIFMRLSEANTRVLSLPDDYFSVFLTSLFVILGLAVLLAPAMLPVFFIIGGLLALYLPFSKIRHCMYFFYSKFFFGLGFGRRGVIGQPKSKYAE